ncbi:MAG TPA: glycosyltransferase family 2 protein [Planctomycetota bacterium]
MNNTLHNPPPVTAIVVSYQSREATARAVSSLAVAWKRGLADCIVVDNASSDGTVRHLKEQHPWVTVIANAQNVGFGVACNQGIDRVRSPYVLLLNPDAVLYEDPLEVLRTFMDRTPACGMAAPAVGMPNGIWQHAGGMPTPMQLLTQAMWPSWQPPRTTVIPGSDPFETDWLCGAVLLLRRSMLEQIGYFDPRFFLYFEETDLCRRARTRGWQLWAVGRAVAEHVGGVSARATGTALFHGCLAEHYYRSRFLYFVKHHGMATACMTELAELAIMSVMSSARWAIGRDVTSFRLRLRAPILGLTPAGRSAAIQS